MLERLEEEAADPAVQEQARACRGELADTMNELGDLARGVHPSVLTSAGVGEALAAVVRRVAAPAVDLDVPDRRFAPEIESTLYFAACEALANAVKHARADRVRVSVRAVPDGIVAEVSDDGVGLPARPPRRPPGESGGLTGVQDRVAALRGRVEITGGPDTGTTVRVTLPEITR